MFRRSSCFKQFLLLICFCSLFVGNVQRLHAQVVSLEEDFDSVTAPALPSGWSSQSLTGSQDAITSTDSFDTSPNSAKLPAPERNS